MYELNKWETVTAMEFFQETAEEVKKRDLELISRETMDKIRRVGELVHEIVQRPTRIALSSLSRKDASSVSRVLNKTPEWEYVRNVWLSLHEIEVLRILKGRREWYEWIDKQNVGKNPEVRYLRISPYEFKTVEWSNEGIFYDDYGRQERPRLRAQGVMVAVDGIGYTGSQQRNVATPTEAEPGAIYSWTRMNYGTWTGASPVTYSLFLL
jgi:hypothetical protein